MNVPEYFSLFSGEGEFSVRVQFKGDGFVAPRKATAQEIVNLMNPQTGTFHTSMRFDDHLFEVYQYEIDPIKKQLLVKARRHDQL